LPGIMFCYTFGLVKRHTIAYQAIKCIFIIMLKYADA
jgi:hypothetical protein